MPHVTTNGIQSFYRSVGTGPALLLIAGNGMDHTTFDEQLPLFGKHFRCIVYDMRGIGQSDVPEGGYTTREMAKDAFALLDALGIEKAHVAGYSLGGAIAQEMALAGPARVLSLSLYSSFDKPAPYMRLRYDILIKVLHETTPELLAMFSAFSAFGEDFINAHEQSIREEIAKRAQRWHMPNAPSKTGLGGHYQAILDHDTSDRLSRIACPTWIAVGSADPVTPVASSLRMHAAIADSRLDVFPGKPHRILNFEAEAFTAMAFDFLAGQKGADD